MKINCYWEITKKCNLTCLHCISSKKDNQKELNSVQALKVVEILGSWGCEEISLTGGEPLIRDDIWEIIKRAKERKIKVSLLTNGTFVTEENIEKIKKYIKEIGLSIDGSSSRINDLIRGNGVFKNILRATDLLNKNKITLTWYITFNKINLLDVPNILKLAKHKRVKYIRLNEITFRGKAFKNKKILKFSNEEKSQFLNNLYKIFRKDKIKELNKCLINKDVIFLSPSGEIFPCVEIFQKNPYLNFGNILKVKKTRLIKLFKRFSKNNNKQCSYNILVGPNFSLCVNLSYSCSLLKCLKK